MIYKVRHWSTLTYVLMGLILHCWWKGWLHPSMIAHCPMVSQFSSSICPKEINYQFWWDQLCGRLCQQKGHCSSSEEAKNGKGRYHFFQWQYGFESDYNGHVTLACIAQVCSNHQVLFGRALLVSSVACHLLTPFEMILLKISIGLFTVQGKGAIYFLSNCQNVRNKPASWEITLCLFPYFGEWSCITRFCNVTIIQLDKKTALVGLEGAGSTANCAQ